MRRLWRYIRGLDPRLPRSVWTMEIGGFANAFGNGSFPFLLIYLHNVRGFSLPMVGLIAATSAAAGIVTVPIAGIVVDRFGGKRTLIGSLVVLVRRIRRHTRWCASRGRPSLFAAQSAGSGTGPSGRASRR